MSETPPIDTLLAAGTERQSAHLAMLREFAEIGMDLARGIRDRVITVADPALAYSRIGATLHKMIQLEDRLAHAHLKRVETRENSRKVRAKGERIAKQHSKAQLREALERTAEVQLDPTDLEPVMEDIKRRIEDPDIQADLTQRPIPDIAEDLYRELLAKRHQRLLDPEVPDSG